MFIYQISPTTQNLYLACILFRCSSSGNQFTSRSRSAWKPRASLIWIKWNWDSTSARGSRNTWDRSRWQVAIKRWNNGQRPNYASTTTSSHTLHCWRSTVIRSCWPSSTICFKTKPFFKWGWKLSRQRSKTHRNESFSPKCWTTFWSCGRAIYRVHPLFVITLW